MNVTGMENGGSSAVGAALCNLAFDAGEVRGLTLAFDLQSYRLVEGAKRLNTLAGSRHPFVQRRVVRQVGEAAPGLSERMRMVRRTAVRHPATRIGGIQDVGHGELRSGVSRPDERGGGEECGSTCGARGSRLPEKKK